MIKPYIYLKRQPNSIEDFQRLAEEQYGQMAVESRQVRAEKSRVVEVIDMLLKIKSPDMLLQLKEIVSCTLFQSIQRYDDELTTFARVMSIYEEEKKAGKIPLLERVESAAELYEIYVKTFFGMRRLELDMPEESKEEFIQLILRYDMSAIYLVNVWMWHPFYNLSFLVQQLVMLLYENGMEILCEEICEKVEALDK